jgi:hypothetical protein
LRSVYLVAFVALGCAATASLRASPNVICAGRTVQLTWSGSTSGDLSADPADTSLGPVPDTGSKTVHPKLTTTYRLHVSTLLGAKTSEASVKVVSAPEQPTTIGAPISDDTAGCAPDRVWVTARVPADLWDPQLHVSTVASADNRSYKVKHSSTTADVSPGSPSDAFRDQPIAGAWKLETPLRPGEVCGKPSLPRSLAIQVTLLCAE